MLHQEKSLAAREHRGRALRGTGALTDYISWFGFRSSRATDVQGKIKQGFAITVVPRLQGLFGFAPEELLNTLSISPRTFERRKEGGRLTALESDRALRLARVYFAALRLYEADKGGAVSWLKTANRALGGLAPVELIKTEEGARRVEDLINRLDYGVYS